MNTPLVGVLGGMGPQAGLDMASKIIAETRAEKDQDHIPLVIFSMPEHILNRTAYLLHNAQNPQMENPAFELGRQLQNMERLGVTVAGMACNTAHARPIFEALMTEKERVAPQLKVLHLIEETVSYIKEHLPHVSRVGVLATSGTYQFRLYDDLIESAGLTALRPRDEIASSSLQDAINHPIWGVKAESNPVSERAVRLVTEAIDDLSANGAEAIVLGCTELPLAVPSDRIRTAENVANNAAHANMPVIIDPTRILARALIRDSYPEKLKPTQ